MKNHPYAGKIQNGGSQVIKVNPIVKKGNADVKSGTDLRTGKGKN